MPDPFTVEDAVARNLQACTEKARGVEPQALNMKLRYSLSGKSAEWEIKSCAFFTIIPPGQDKVCSSPPLPTFLLGMSTAYCAQPNTTECPCVVPISVSLPLYHFYAFESVLMSDASFSKSNSHLCNR